jgi:hypothetical protein
MEKSVVICILAVLVFFATTANAQLFQIGTYKVTKTKVAGWGITAVGGALDGILEGYAFDGRKSFERKYGVSKYGYFGSESWRNVYIQGNPENGFKSPLHGWAGAWDFYHHADDGRKLGYIGGSIILGIGGAKLNNKWWHYAADFTISFAISAAAKSAGMYYIRK